MATDTLALEKLYRDVVELFAGEGTQADNLFGWRIPAQQVIGPRIAWVPGDPSGKAGQAGAARNPGRNPRPIGTLYEKFHVVISAQDPTDPENELLQYKATRLLRDAWHRAVYLSARGTFALDSEDWDQTAKERRFGTALIIVCTIQSMIPDEPLVAVPVDTGAVIAVSTLDTTDTLTVSPADEP
jgi:hypothetical protein